MITLINAVMSPPATMRPKLRSITTSWAFVVPRNTTPENSELMNVSGTTTIATIKMSLDAFAL